MLTASQIAFRDRIIERGVSLIDAGYRIGQNPYDEAIFHVATPEGHEPAFYTVIAGDEGIACCCPCYERVGICKHQIAVEQFIREEAMSEAAAADEEAALYWEDMAAERARYNPANYATGGY